MEFRVLGALEVRAGDRHLPLGGPKQRALLAHLLLSPDRFVTTQGLLRDLWVGKPPRSARANLRTYVADLRRSLDLERRNGSRIVTRPDGYRLLLEPAELDLLRFEELADAGQAALAGGDPARAEALLGRALRLWRGRPAENVPLGLGLADAVARLQERHHTIVEHHVDARLALGRHAALIPELVGLVADEPLRERFRVQLMLALYRSGRQAEALQVYQEARRTLVEELGLEPGVELRRMERAVLAGDPALDLPEPTRPPEEAAPAAHAGVQSQVVPQQLPLDVRGFTGRGGELAQLDGVLVGQVESPGAVVIASVSGTAGVGKTALAVRWAHRVRDRFPDGVLFANLRGHDPTGVPVPPEEVLDRFLRALGVPPAVVPPGLAERAALFRTRLDGRRMLILLDNAATSEQVRWLLPNSPGCVVVVTSRSRVSGLVAREGAHRILVDLLPQAEALELLRRLIGPARVDAEPEAAAELARRCARLPLALRLAAERANARPHLRLADLAGELAREGDRLDLLATGDDETAALRAVFSWSYQALTPEAARGFRLLGLHPGPDVSLAAVAALTGASPQQARRLVDTLVGGHLLEEGAGGRYRLHDLLRLYAREQAHAQDPPAERDAALGRLGEWYLRTADRAGWVLMPHRPRAVLDRLQPVQPPPPGGQPPEFTSPAAALAWYETERANLLAAARQAAEIGRDDLAWRLPAAMWPYFAVRKGYTDWFASYERGLAAALRCGDRYGQALMLIGAIQGFLETRRHDDAFAHADQAITISREIGEPWIEAAALHLTSATHRVLGQYEHAVRCGLRALRLFDTLADPWTAAWTSSTLGVAYANLGRHDESIHHARHALAYFTAVDERLGVSDTSSVLAEVYRGIGQLDRAAEHCGQALTAAREIGNRLLEGVALLTLGDLHHDSGDTGRAQASWSEARAVLEEIGAPHAAEARTRLQDQ